MKKSETEDYNELGFDPYMDFSQFLEEARSHHRSRQVKTETPPLGTEQKMLGEDQRNKSKKSWTSSLFSWLKVNRKSQSRKGPSSTTPLHIPNTRKESVSGPIYGSSEGKAGFTPRAKRPTSGPLTGISILSTLRRGGEVGFDVPYVNLDQLNHPIGQQAYGPVYLVT